jgi:hypothetical protein
MNDEERGEEEDEKVMVFIINQDWHKYRTERIEERRNL